MPSTTTPNLCQAKASYKKIPGLLELSKPLLTWTATGKQKPDLRIPTSQAASLFCSKEGSPQVKLKLALVGNDAGHTFMFTAPQATASAEREVFKRELTMMISENRSNSSAQQQRVQQQENIVPGTPKNFPGVSRATSVSSGRASSLGPAGAPDDLQLRKKVLVKNSELAKLHRDLVLSGQITEAEFWEGRESLLIAEASQENQRRGRPGKLVDPRPETVAGGDIKIVITPQLVHDIFEEYPVVAKAYSENVPKPMNESEFWKRYFQSRLFNSHRASIRSSAAQHIVKDDPIFDKYVEKDDDELEPRRQRDEELDIFVDLVTTQEDHVETGNKRDLTMQAGRQRGALPLIRKFNEHSERLLNTAEGGFPNKKRRTDDGGQSLYESIDLDDLHDLDSSSGVVLEMKDRDRYYDGRTGDQSSLEDKPVFRLVLPEVRGQLNDWSKALGSLNIGRKAGDAALLTMTQNVQARLEVKLKKNDIPESIFAQMRTCQTAANEFLRQYWSAIYPPSDAQTLGISTPAQKAAKAAKMIGYLASTQEKVDAIVKAASSAGAEPAKIEVAMKPVVNAVEKALQFHRNRKPVR